MARSASAVKPLDKARTADAALTLIRLFRSMERVVAGLTPQQYRVLKLIGAGGERSAKLAERLAIAKPTLTSTADGLVAAGLLQRETEIRDRRVVRLVLTEAGLEAVRQADDVYAGWLSELLGATRDPERLLADLAELDHALDEVLRVRRAAKTAQSKETNDRPKARGERGVVPPQANADIS